MDKEQLLQEVSLKIASGEISREELTVRLGLKPTAQFSPQSIAVADNTRDGHFTVTKMLYVLGAGIVSIGVLIFIAQLWDDIGTVGRILITLGLGVLFAALGSMLLQQVAATRIGQVFHAIGGFLIPGGAIVALTDLNIDSRWSIAMVFVGISIMYVLLNFVHKNIVLTVFTISNATVAGYLVCIAVFEPILKLSDDLNDVILYLTMTFGLCYLALAYVFKGGFNEGLTRTLYLFGITGFLAAAFSQVFDSVFWQLLYFLVVFGGLFMSVYLKSKIILLMSTIFLIVHVSFITSEYFADSLGWPVALVLLGFVFIGLGYASITINNRYINN